VQYFVLLLLLLAPAAIYVSYGVIYRHIRARAAPVDPEHQRIFWGHLPEACPYCGTKNLEMLGGDKFRCMECVWRGDS
jgi:hypothetical protein